jgi:plasmid stabilization system protein ParE
MRALVTRPQAQLDVEEAVVWYESKEPGLGIRFLGELDSLMERIRAAPLQFPRIDSSVRRGLLKRFPYSVYFSADSERVELIAVLHQHRYPEAWKSRLR